jgi:hypothetical protein
MNRMIPRFHPRSLDEDGLEVGVGGVVVVVVVVVVCAVCRTRGVAGVGGDRTGGDGTGWV